MSSPPPSPKSVALADGNRLTLSSQSSSSESSSQSSSQLSSANSKRISEEINQAESRFQTLRSRLGTLLSAAKEQNASMVAFSESQIKEAHQYEVLLNKSPLEAVVGKTYYDPQGAGKGTNKSSTAKKSATISKAPAATSSESDGAKATPAPAVTDSPKSKGTTSPKNARNKNGATDGTSGNGSVDVLTPVKVDSIALEQSDFDHVDATLGSVIRASRDLTTKYASRQEHHLLKYIEDWERVVSFKVHGRMGEYRKLQDDLRHYQKKVGELQGDISKAEGKSKKVKGKDYDKLSRNEVKLEGAREAHDSYGETLLLLMEEVTERAWRDVVPLLAMRLKFYSRYYADQAKIFAHLDEAMNDLATTGGDNDVEVGGRLKDINAKRPEEFYTGEREVICVPKKRMANAPEAPQIGEY